MELHGSSTGRARRRMSLVAVVGVATAVLAGCGAASYNPQPNHGKPQAHLTAAGTMPRACSDLTKVRTPETDPPGLQDGHTFFTAEQFGAFVRGAPYLVATLDSHGLHFSRASVVGGTYDICFVDRRAKDKGKDIALDFYVSGPRVMMSSVHAGTIGPGLFCPGAETGGIFIDDVPATNVPSSNDEWVAIVSSPGCHTVVT